MSALRFAGLALAGAAALGGCTWVEPDARGLEVEVAGPERDLSGCLRRGEVTVSVKHEVAGFERNEMKVRDELESLARNEAAKLRASHVQAVDEPRLGEQGFIAYDCVSPQ